MCHKISKVISAQNLAKYLKSIYAIDDFSIRVAKFFSDQLDNTELKEDVQILLLLLLSTVKKGLSKALKKDLISTLNTSIKDEELYSLLLNEGFDKNGIENFLSGGLINIKECISKWIDYLCETNAYNLMRPIVGETIDPSSFSQPLVICNPRNKVFWFQAYYLAENFLEKERDALLLTDSNSLEIDKVAQILKEIIEKEFQSRTPHIRQIAAIIIALLKRVVVISGGPGTGKSSVVNLILRALTKYYNIPPDRIAICAPTGRAKSRLLEALNVSSDISFSNLSAYTIHSLLGIGSNSSLNDIFFYKEKLPYKLIVVDEVSMVDIRLFSALIERISSDCKLILIGDTEQLPPVDAGAVLGNLNFIRDNNFASLSIETVNVIKNILELCNFSFDLKELYLMATKAKSKLVDHIVFLTKNYRSDILIIDWWNNFIYSGQAPVTDHNSCITYFSKKEIINKDKSSRAHLESLLKKWVERWYDYYFEWKEKFGEKIASCKEALLNNEIASEFSKLISKIRILCYRNEGEQGRIFINEFCKNYLWLLKAKKGISPKFHDGIPIIVTRNQYNIELYNGDIGIVVEDKGRLYANFIPGKGIVRIPLYSINHIDTAFAITVHKSQGSEFDEIMFVIPEKSFEPLSKELIYTAITRARKKVTILDYGDVLSNIKNLKTEERYSVLGELWG